MVIAVTSNGKLECRHCPIHDHAVCARCDETELARLEDAKYYRHFDAGQPIAWANDELNFVASVVSGAARLTQTLEDGRTQMVGLLLPSDFIGRPGRGVSPYDITAATPVTLCCFRIRPFEKLMAEMPHVAGRLLDMTLDELEAAREWMLILGRKTAREKVASLLVIVARRETAIGMQPDPSALRIDLPLTREAIADYLGLTLETVSRQIGALRRDKVIDLDGRRRVLIPNLARLKAETGDELIA